MCPEAPKSLPADWKQDFTRFPNAHFLCAPTTQHWEGTGWVGGPQTQWCHGDGPSPACQACWVKSTSSQASSLPKHFLSSLKAERCPRHGRQRGHKATPTQGLICACGFGSQMVLGANGMNSPQGGRDRPRDPAGQGWQQLPAQERVACWPTHRAGRFILAWTLCSPEPAFHSKHQKVLPGDRCKATKTKMLIYGNYLFLARVQRKWFQCP